MAYIHNFKTPVLYNEVSYSTITFDFNKLTGKDALAIERELVAQGIPVTVPSLIGDYLVRVCAKAADAPLGVDFFEMIPLKDWNLIRNNARNFMLSVAED